QFTATTARKNGLVVRSGHDQRLDAEAATIAAVGHLRRLHRMFGGDWRWTAMAYNAGEGAARAARRKGGLPRLSAITRHYPDKLHALACLVPRPPDPPQPTR
ncbi:MAG: lytic transglycosylase domain-containing protein, partial [Lysobacteraceae bacterium]